MKAERVDLMVVATEEVAKEVEARGLPESREATTGVASMAAARVAEEMVVAAETVVEARAEGRWEDRAAMMVADAVAA